MSNRADLLAALQSARATVAALEAALADREGRAPCALAPVTPPEPDDRDDWITTAVAARIAKVSYSTLYRWCDKFGIGERTRSGQRKISRRALLAVVAMRRSGEIGENGDAEPIPLATREAHPALPLSSPPEPQDE